MASSREKLKRKRRKRDGNEGEEEDYQPKSFRLTNSISENVNEPNDMILPSSSSGSSTVNSSQALSGHYDITLSTTRLPYRTLSNPSVHLVQGNTTQATNQTEHNPLDVLFQVDLSNAGSHAGHVTIGTLNPQSTSGTDHVSASRISSNTSHASHVTNSTVDDLFSVEDTHVDTPHNNQLRVTVNIHYDGDREDVIVVDSGDEEDDDVVVVQETRMSEDELIARRLQSQLNTDRSHDTGETFGTAISTRSFMRDDTDGSSNSSEIIRDNMDALATRIDNWTVADARRFLMVAIPHQRRSSRMSRQTFERNLTRINPMLLYAAIMGQSHSLPPIGSNMGSYEDLLELAERLGPARSPGLTDEMLSNLPTRKFNGESCQDDPSKLSCVICMSEYQKNDVIKSLPCLHDFHSNCIDPWLKCQRTCPICRNEIEITSTSS